MRRLLLLLLLVPTFAFAQEPSAPVAEQPDDPYLWLEDVEGEEALAWARERNEETIAAIRGGEGGDELDALSARLLEVFDASDKIPRVSKIGDRYYNLWKDAEHKRGLWRRTTLESWKTDTPEWETVLDLDALGAAEGENWVWKYADCLPPEYQRCMLSLSRGGADATVMREFDLGTKSFVTKKPFELPEAKQWTDWIDKNTLYVGTDFGEGSLTDSGYARQVKVWKRGKPLSKAKLAFEGEVTDVSAGAWRDHRPGHERDFAWRSKTFFTNEIYLLTKKGPQKVDKPDGAKLRVWKDHALIELRADWAIGGEMWQAGSLLVADFDAWMAGDRTLEPLFVPTETAALDRVEMTANHLVITILDMVSSRVEVLTPTADGWSRAPLDGAPGLGTLRFAPVDTYGSDAFWLTITDFLTPTSIAHGVIGSAPAEVLKQRKERFDASDLVTTQHLATSADGTEIPYFQVARKDLAVDGSNPTLLYGYGGFEVSLMPGYSATRGMAWLEKGGVYVIANIRGGGEFGPGWHQAALKDKRLRAYEDFAAVAQDLVARGVTSRERLACRGGSNGGLLTGNMYTLYAELFGGIISSVPLLDMRRYNQLLAGASWMGEYGDPDDPEQWAYIREFSPYHNVDPARDYPPLLITTSTRDDRVHPAHARKMVALLKEHGKDVAYYENIEGGHGGAADNSQAAFLYALQYTWTWQQLSKPLPAPATDSQTAE